VATITRAWQQPAPGTPAVVPLAPAPAERTTTWKPPVPQPCSSLQEMAAALDPNKTAKGVWSWAPKMANTNPCACPYPANPYDRGPSPPCLGYSQHGGAPAPSGSSTHPVPALPRNGSRDVGSSANPNYRCGKIGINEYFDCNKDFLLRIGFNAPDTFGKIMPAHWAISQSWSSKSSGTHGPQKDIILKSMTFLTKLVLDSFEAPMIVQWYKRLTATCEAFQIGLVPFNAIQIRQCHKGLCLPGLGIDRYLNSHEGVRAYP
jgi:hypothetical protein